MTTDALKKLHTAMLDTREGYEVAERDADTPALKKLFAEMIAMRTQDHRAIHAALTQKGEHPDESGSFMATIHKTMTSARAAVTGLDTKALSPFVSGEESIAEKYDAAIVEASGDAATHDMLVGQRNALKRQIEKMKAMQTA